MPLTLTSLSTIDPEGAVTPYIVSDESIARYAEWRFQLDEKVVGTISPTELETAPSAGLNKPDGVYKFSFDTGHLYLVLEDKRVTEISGYSTEEIGIFHEITKEHGENIGYQFKDEKYNMRDIKPPIQDAEIIDG